VSEGLSKSLFSSMIRASPEPSTAMFYGGIVAQPTVRMWPQCTPPASHSDSSAASCRTHERNRATAAVADGALDTRRSIHIAL